MADPKNFVMSPGGCEEVALTKAELKIFKEALADHEAGHLDRLKAAKNDQINQWREEANFSSFPFRGKQISCDRLSRSDIDATDSQVLRMQALPAGWMGGWKTVDNTYVTISTVADWNELYGAMYEQGQANFAKSQALKDTLAAATSEEQINSIVWQQGGV